MTSKGRITAGQIEITDKETGDLVFKVPTTQSAAVTDATATYSATQINAVLAVLRRYGMIAES